MNGRTKTATSGTDEKYGEDKKKKIVLRQPSRRNQIYFMIKMNLFNILYNKSIWGLIMHLVW